MKLTAPAFTADRLRRVLGTLRRGSSFIVLGSAVGIALAAYYNIVTASYFFDDPFDLTRVEGRSYWTLLSSSDGYQYYRPVPFVLWKLLRSVQGHYDHTTLHFLPLVAHAVSGWLLYSLLRRFGIGYWALIPMVLFLTAPFHYQVLPIIGPTAHVLAGMFILASLNLYLSARLSQEPIRSRWLHLAALAMSCLALWSHESGVVVGPLVVGLEAILWFQRRERRWPSFWPAAHTIAALTFLVVWSTVDKLPSTEQTNLAEARPKALFFLQGFTYPVSAQLVWVEDHFGITIGILRAGFLAIVIPLAAYWISARRTGHRSSILLPLAGIAVAVIVSAPSMLRLSWGYVENGPRLLYLVMIGAALFWGLLPSLDFGNRGVTMVWRVTTATLLLGVVVQSWRFVDIRLDMFERGSATISSIVRLGEQYRGQRVLVTNLPSWFAMNRYEYRSGHYGVQLVPTYVGLDRVVYVNSRQAPTVDIRSVTWQADVSGGKYPFGPHGIDAPPEQIDGFLREGRELVTVTPIGNDYVVRDVGRLTPGAAEQLPDFPGRVGDGIWLDSIRVARTSAHHDLATIFITWNVIEPLSVDVDAVVEVHDTNGAVVFKRTGYALDGMSAPRLWRAGDKVEDSIAFPLPADGDYAVYVGLQRVGTDERLPAFDPSGQPVPDDLLPIGEMHVRAGVLSTTAP